MHRFLILAMLIASGAIILAAPAQAQAARPLAGVAYAGGDGKTCDDAVVIKGARNSAAGMVAQKAWIARKHPDARRTGSAVRRKGAQTFDVITLKDGAGQVTSVCFDISAFFGTW